MLLVLAEPRSLKDICRGVIRTLVGKRGFFHLDQLGLPEELLNYLLHL